MGSLIAKLKRSISNPEIIPTYLKTILEMNLKWLKQGDFFRIIGSFTSGTLGSNIYLSYLQKSNENSVICAIHNYKMALNPNLKGINQELIMYRTREDLTAQIYRNELRKLSNKVESITILEIGANIGYYALMEASLLKDKAHIYAFEPDPRNIDLLKESININDFSDYITVSQRAIGDEVKRVNVELADQSNKTKVKNDKDSSKQIIEVEQTTVDSILEEYELNPGDINVVRMDVEGYEYHVFRGMSSILKSDNPLLIFFELHAHEINHDNIM